MQGSRARCALAAMVGGLVGSLAAAGAAQAGQFTPTASARAHTPGSGQPGVEYNSSGIGVGGQVAYDSGTGTLTVNGVVDVVNYYDPGNGSCPTDAGSNCAYNTSPDYELVMDAVLVDVDVESLGSGFYNIIANFASTPNAAADVTWTDPTDASEVLRGSWVAGTYDDGFGPTATSGLTAVVLFDSNTGTATFNLQDTRGFLAADATTSHASLFDNGDGNYFALDIGSVTDFSDGSGGDLDDIVAAAFANGFFPSFTAEINGQLFRMPSGSFVVPEPATALLLGLGLAALGARRRGR